MAADVRRAATVSKRQRCPGLPRGNWGEIQDALPQGVEFMVHFVRSGFFQLVSSPEAPADPKGANASSAPHRDVMDGVSYHQARMRFHAERAHGLKHHVRMGLAGAIV